MRNANLVFLVLMIFATFGLANPALSKENFEGKIVYLTNGQEISADKSWPGPGWQTSKEFEVWFQMGTSAVPISSSFVNLEKTFGDDFVAEREQIAREQENKQKADMEARTAMHSGNTGKGINTRRAVNQDEMECRICNGTMYATSEYLKIRKSLPPSYHRKLLVKQLLAAFNESMFQASRFSKFIEERSLFLAGSFNSFVEYHEAAEDCFVITERREMEYMAWLNYERIENYCQRCMN